MELGIRKTCNNYTLINAVQKYRLGRKLFEHGSKLSVQKYNVLTFVDRRTLLCHCSNE
jgi:hypothetical protein